MSEKFQELLDDYWRAAYDQGVSQADYDGDNRAAENAERAVLEFVIALTRERDEARADAAYWKVEAEGERAKVEFRDRQLERYRLANTEDNDLSILAREIDASVRALVDKPDGETDASPHG